jgi:hypothetical protein
MESHNKLGFQLGQSLDLYLSDFRVYGHYTQLWFWLSGPWLFTIICGFSISCFCWIYCCRSIIISSYWFVDSIRTNIFLLGKDFPILISCGIPKDLSVTIINTRFRIDIRIRLRSGFHLGPERLLPLVPRSNLGLIVIINID